MSNTALIFFALCIHILVTSTLLCQILDNIRDIKYVLHDIRKGLENAHSTKHST